MKNAIIPYRVRTRSMTDSSRTLRSSVIKKEEDDSKVSLTLQQKTTTTRVKIKSESVEQDSKHFLSNSNEGKNI
jgi:hypothetical protein